MTRTFIYNFTPPSLDPSPGATIALDVSDIEDAGIREVLQTPGAAYGAWSILDALLTPTGAGTSFHFRQPLGQAREVKVALSGLFGRFVARAYLERYFGLSIFAHLGNHVIDLDRRKQTRIKRLTRGDLPDWIACKSDLTSLTIAEAKGCHDPGGPAKALARAWTQAGRIDVTVKGRRVTVKRIAVATRWGVANSNPADAYLSVRDPVDEGDPIDPQDKDAPFIGLLRLHVANMIEPLGHAELAQALRTLTRQTFPRPLRERRVHDVGVLERRSTEACAEDFGLSLAEGKVILKESQQAVLQDQVEEISEIERVCQTCQTYLPIHDRRSRRIDTLFGRVTVEAPRVRICMSRFPGFPNCTAAFSPLTRMLPGNATPEFCKLQADLAARHSFREAARILNALTPCARQNHTTIRNRLASVADGLEARCDETQKDPEVQSGEREMTVFLDSAYVRSRPEYQRRNFEVIVGSIESKVGNKRRFRLSLAGADHPLECLKSNLKAAGWRPGSAKTVLSDGDPALPRLVRNATNGNVEHILDWWHIFARIRHVETTFQTLLSQLENSETADVEALVERLRWRIWHGQTHRALETLGILFRFAMQARDCAVGNTREAALSTAARTIDLPDP
jgi:hypothetical protein